MKHEEDEDQIDDRDMPRPEDMDSEDDAGTDPCPFCKKPIFEDSEWCPHCGKYLSRDENQMNTPLWITIMVLIFLIGMGLTIWR